MNYRQRLEKGIYNVACDIVRVLGIIIFFLLTVASLLSSEYILPGSEELPVNKTDLPIFSFLFPTLICLAVVPLSQVGKGKLPYYKTRILHVFLFVTMAWVMGASAWWILTNDCIPEGDQAYVYAAASYFLEGDFTFFQPGGYCQIYPGQLGFIGALEILFSRIGAFQYFGVEVLNVLFIGGIVYIGYEIVKILDHTFEIGMIYLVFMWGCLPLIFYASWVYNDIPGIFFMLLSTMFFLRDLKSDNVYHLPFGLISGVVAVLIRPSNLIFLVALLCVSLVNLVYHRGWQLFLAVLLTFVACYFAANGVRNYYEKVSEQEIGKGLPVNSWIAMGMQERRGASGWYNNMPKEIGEANDWDYEATKEYMDRVITGRLEEFVGDPKMAFEFYAKKVLSQWNNPLYQSVYFSAKSRTGMQEGEGNLASWVMDYEDGYFTIFEFANLWHFMIFLGAFLYFLLVNEEGKHPLTMLPAVTILGGFFFSILWEAKARYILPYYILMYPLSAWGYVAFARKTRKMVIWRKVAKLRNGRDVEEEEQEEKAEETPSGPMTQEERIARMEQLKRIEELEREEKGEEKPTRKVWANTVQSVPEMITSSGEVKKRPLEDHMSKSAVENRHNTTNASQGVSKTVAPKKTVYEMRNETRNPMGTAKNASIKQGAIAKATQTKVAASGAGQKPGQGRPSAGAGAGRKTPGGRR